MYGYGCPSKPCRVYDRSRNFLRDHDPILFGNHNHYIMNPTWTQWAHVYLTLPFDAQRTLESDFRKMAALATAMTDIYPMLSDADREKVAECLREALPTLPRESEFEIEIESQLNSDTEQTPGTVV